MSIRPIYLPLLALGFAGTAFGEAPLPTSPSEDAPELEVSANEAKAESEAVINDTSADPMQALLEAAADFDYEEPPLVDRPVTDDVVDADVDGSEPSDATADETDNSAGDEPLIAFDAPNAVNPFDEVRPFDQPFETPLADSRAAEADRQEVEKLAEEYLETSAAMSAAQDPAAALAAKSATAAANSAAAGVAIVDPKRGTVRLPQSTASSHTEAMQRALNSQGFALEIDGRKGPKTVEALRTFQERQGLVASGELDSATKNRLGL